MIHSLRVPLLALALLFVGFATAYSQDKGRIPRTPDGHPDLQGTWNSATLTPMERPKEFADKTTVSAEEALAYEKKPHPFFKEEPDLPPPILGLIKDSNAIGAEQSEIWELATSLARVDGVIRTSLIIDPPDGQYPALTPEGKQRSAARLKNFNHADSVKDLDLSERCIDSAAIPILPMAYNSNFQIVQTSERLMIFSEMIHDVRIARMNATHVPAAIRQPLGDSIGHWEGDTLVIDTTNFNGKISIHGSTQTLHVIERFTLLKPGTLLYQATIEDPAIFTKPFTIEFPLAATAERIFEYACHEGNHDIEAHLKAARKEDTAAVK